MAKSKGLKLSFCIPVYNKVAYLAQCIDSLTSQTYKNIQIVMVDDCSTDDSYELMQYFAKKYDFVKIHKNETNCGVGFTREIARELADGEIICVQDADDLSTEYRAEEVNKFFMDKANKDIGLVYGHCALINPIGQHIGNSEAKNFSISALKKENFIQHPTVAFRKNIKVEYRRVRFIDDWYFYFDCVKAGVKFGKIDQLLGIYRPLNEGLTLEGGQNSKEKEALKAKLKYEFKSLDDAVGYHLKCKDSIQYTRGGAILKEIKTGSKVLDVGCNDGTLMEMLKKKGCSVVGIEFASNLVELCRHKGLEVYEMDIQKGIRPEKFDYIVLGDILEHYKPAEIGKIIENCRLMLGSGGKLVITVPYKHGAYNSEANADHITDIDGSMLGLNDMVEKPIITKGYAIPIWLIITGN